MTAHATTQEADAPPPVAQMLEDILGCKWSLTILGLIRNDVCRPGAIERAVAGLSTKVMNERLAKLTRYQIVARVAYPEVPPRVEYHLTAFGQRFVAILDAIAALDYDTRLISEHHGTPAGPEAPLTVEQRSF